MGETHAIIYVYCIISASGDVYSGIRNGWVSNQRGLITCLFLIS
jgi:hypothetical protein